MATHTYFQHGSALYWGDLGGTITSVTPTLVILTNSDGTLTYLFGSNFAENPVGTLSAGTITQMERRNAAGGSVLERIQSISYDADTFSANLANDSAYTTVFSELFVDNDTILGGQFFGGGRAGTVLRGFDGNDFIRDNDVTNPNADDTLDGGAGNDTLESSGGVDVLDGGDDVDVAIIDRTSGSLGETFDLTNPALLSTLADGTTIVNVESVQLRTGSGNDSLTGGALNDRFDSNNGDDTLFGAGGNDTLFGGSGNDELYGGDGIDNLSGSFGDDVLDGGAGNDFLDGGSDQDSISGGDDDDRLFGQDGNDTLSGDAGNDSLDGGNGNDTLDGGAGNDTLNAFQGTDALDGGDDFDRANISRSASSLAENVDFSDPTITATLADGTTVINVEEINFSGGSGNDTVTGGIGNDTLNGGLGDDVLSGFSGDDTFNLNGNDTVDGGSGNDRINVFGNPGIVSIDGGADDDFVIINRFSSTVDETIDLSDPSVQQTFSDGSTLVNVEGGQFQTGSGNDRIVTGALNDWIDTGAGNDTIDAGGGTNQIYARDGDDVITDSGMANPASLSTSVFIDGGAGTDFLTIDRSGFAADLTFDVLAIPVIATSGYVSIGDGTAIINIEQIDFTGGSGNDEVSGGLFDDTINGGAGRDELTGRAGNDVLIGGDGLDLLDGGDGDDQLSGGAGFDTLDGGSGNDTLDGGTGFDTMIGGTGDDTYIVDQASDITFESPGEGIDLVRTTVDLTLAANIENLILEGAALYGGGNALGNVITGTAAANTLNGAGGADTINAGAGDDTITAGAGDLVAGEEIDGGDDVDTLVINGGGTVDLTGVSFSGMENAVLTDAAGTRVILSRAQVEAFSGTLDGQGAADTFAVTDLLFLGTFGTPASRQDAFQFISDLHAAGIENVEWQEGGATNVATLDGGVVTVTSTDPGGDTGGLAWSTSTFTFDAVSGNRLSKVTVMDDGSIVTRDFGGALSDTLLTQTTTSIPGPQDTSTITFDSAGRWDSLEITYDAGGSTRYDYDDAGRIDALTQTKTNGLIETTTFDDAGRRTSLTQEDTGGVFGGWQSSETTFDPASGLVTGRTIATDVGNAVVETYAGGTIETRVTSDVDMDDPWSTITQSFVGGVLDTTYHVYDDDRGILQGTAGANTLTGAIGIDDAMIGRDGADTFVFLVGGGADRVLDFDAAEGDKLDLQAFQVTSKADIEAKATITQTGPNLVLDFGGGDTVQVNGIDFASLADGDLFT